ncbi:glutathione S-transferase C-terminal-like protein [Fomitopsis serialis]|uniref:glutathione S-transferase C-terminal-like protein n=1 Tax=Fomitopsis serialis TaxID=139415 RepID=UPI0020088110|nr:glutathione S-transferase C-terminal-like protein [Neoantrodia serialis]KAH9919129.1 glutathione S-transferase C-terminal-like protein [Neoantrodia serialis]
MSKKFVLYMAGTPNSRKVSIVLELHARYGVDYQIHEIDMSKNEHKEPWYLKLNPNGRVPTLVDQFRNDFAIFESAAIELYLAQHFDRDFNFSFDPVRNPVEYSEMLQWIFFTHSGIGPNLAQAAYFVHFATEDVPHAKKRFIDEVKRLYGIYNTRLEGRHYFAGPRDGLYTIADINAYPLVVLYALGGVESLDEWPNLKAWVRRMEAHPAVKAGMTKP